MPTPLSPVISTLASQRAACSISSSTLWIAALTPTIVTAVFIREIDSEKSFATRGPTVGAEKPDRILFLLFAHQFWASVHTKSTKKVTFLPLSGGHLSVELGHFSRRGSS